MHLADVVRKIRAGAPPPPLQRILVRNTTNGKERILYDMPWKHSAPPCGFYVKHRVRRPRTTGVHADVDDSLEEQVTSPRSP